MQLQRVLSADSFPFLEQQLASLELQEVLLPAHRASASTAHGLELVIALLSLSFPIWIMSAQYSFPLGLSGGWKRRMTESEWCSVGTQKARQTSKCQLRALHSHRSRT